jgi:hypothetical protein
MNNDEIHHICVVTRHKKYMKIVKQYRVGGKVIVIVVDGVTFT